PAGPVSASRESQSAASPRRRRPYPQRPSLQLRSARRRTPGGHRLVEDAVARRALLQGENGALAGLIDEGEVDPVPLFQEREIGGNVAGFAGERNPIEAVGDLCVDADQRLAARLLGRLHYHLDDFGDALAGKIGRRVELDFDEV